MRDIMALFCIATMSGTQLDRSIHVPDTSFLPHFLTLHGAIVRAGDLVPRKRTPVSLVLPFSFTFTLTLLCWTCNLDVVGSQLPAGATPSDERPLLVDFHVAFDTTVAEDVVAWSETTWMSRSVIE